MKLVFWIGRGIAVVLALLVLTVGGFRLAAHVREDAAPAELAPKTGRFIDISDAQIFLQSLGPEDGPAVLLVHGTGAWSGLWSETMTELAGAGFRVTAVDLPPFGFSNLESSEDYGRTAQARRLVEIVERMGGPPPAIVGHSYGAGPVAEAALRRPDRFTRLVLIDAAIALDAALSRGLALPLRSQMVRELATSLVGTNPLMTRRLLASLIHRKDRATDTYVEILQRPLEKEGGTEAVARWLPALLVADPEALSHRPEPYASLRLPTVVIWGAMDIVTPIDQGRRLADLVPDASLIVLPDVGHIPQVEDPAAFAKALRKALGRD